MQLAVLSVQTRDYVGCMKNGPFVIAIVVLYVRWPTKLNFLNWALLNINSILWQLYNYNTRNERIHLQQIVDF